MNAKSLTIDDLDALLMEAGDPKVEAIANADAHTNNAGLPTYSELVAALRRAVKEAPRRYGDRRTPHGDRVAEHPAWVADAGVLLSRIPT